MQANLATLKGAGTLISCSHDGCCMKHKPVDCFWVSQKQLDDVSSINQLIEAARCMAHRPSDVVEFEEAIAAVVARRPTLRGVASRSVVSLRCRLGSGYGGHRSVVSRITWERR